MTTRRGFVLGASAVATAWAAALPRFAQAQAFPTKPVTLVVPFAAGGPTDQIARTVAQKMSASLGQPVLVDNRPGGGGQIAAALVKQAPADGHTVFVGATEMFAINQTLFRKFAYDPVKDFRPVGALVETPMLLVVAASSPAHSVQELLALARTRPNGLTYASQGLGSIGHMLGQALSQQAKVPLTHVPYKGSAPALQDLMAERVDLMFDVVMSSGPLIAGHKLKALAVAAPQRSASLPQVPTLAEAGVTGLDASVWFGAVVPAGTPDVAVAALNGAIVQALGSPDVAARFAEQGLQPKPMSASRFGDFMKSEIDRWTPMVTASGAVVD